MLAGLPVRDGLWRDIEPLREVSSTDAGRLAHEGQLFGRPDAVEGQPRRRTLAVRLHAGAAVEERSARGAAPSLVRTLEGSLSHHERYGVIAWLKLSAATLGASLHGPEKPPYGIVDLLLGRVQQELTTRYLQTQLRKAVGVELQYKATTTPPN